MDPPISDPRLEHRQRDDDGLRYLADTINGIVRATFWFRVWVMVAWIAFLWFAISGNLTRLIEWWSA